MIFTQRQKWYLINQRTGMKFEGQYWPEDMVDSANTTWSTVNRLGAEKPLSHWLHGEPRKIQFRATLWKIYDVEPGNQKAESGSDKSIGWVRAGGHSADTFPGENWDRSSRTIVGGGELATAGWAKTSIVSSGTAKGQVTGAGTSGTNTGEQSLEAMLEELRKYIKPEAETGHPPICTFIAGNVCMYCVVESLGDIAYEILKKDGGHRGIRLRIALREYNEQSSIGTVTRSMPKTYIAAPDDTYESIGKKTGKSGNQVRRDNPNLHNLTAGDEVQVYDHVESDRMTPSGMPESYSPTDRRQYTHYQSTMTGENKVMRRSGLAVGDDSGWRDVNEGYQFNPDDYPANEPLQFYVNGDTADATEDESRILSDWTSYGDVPVYDTGPDMMDMPDNVSPNMMALR